MADRMKKLAISQRVDVHETYGERRDCLDQRWYEFANQLDCLPVPLPNIQPDGVTTLMASIQPDAIVLSGGNTLVAQDATAGDVVPERDAFETALLQWALASNTPVLGVCRGMQFINHFFGGTTDKVVNHVAQRHQVSFCGELAGVKSVDVNSFHNYGITPEQLGDELDVSATTADGTVEALSHQSSAVAAIMWHPERESPFTDSDIAVVRRFLGL